MDHDHGKRTKPLTFELSPLEAAIDRFGNQAYMFHKNKRILAEAINETHSERHARENKARQEYTHFEHERRLAISITDVQLQLELYQEKNRASQGEAAKQTKSRNSQMKNEKHHPTTLLANYMRADGRPKPSPKHTAHHIVPGKGRTKSTFRARIRLHSLGIGINDPDNGAWMVRYKENKGHWSMPEAKAHLEIHTNNYESWVERHIKLVSTEGSARTKLEYLRLILQSGTQPKEVTMPPDEDWKGL